MKFLLDTNVLVQILRARPGGALLRKRLDATAPGDAVICAIVRVELMFGAVQSATPERRVPEMREFLAPFHSLPLDDAAADHAASLRLELARRGMPIGPYDLLIAAIAIRNGLTLVTHNTAEFGRVPGLSIVDWETGMW